MTAVFGFRFSVFGWVLFGGGRGREMQERGEVFLVFFCKEESFFLFSLSFSNNNQQNSHQRRERVLGGQGARPPQVLKYVFCF